jgi:Holliday junction DNA helicase RuvA
MIARLRGRVEAIAHDRLVVDIGAISLAVQVPVTLSVRLQPGQAVALFTHFHVREQEMALFGFADEEELHLFQLLITVDGIGPRLALNILSTLSPDSLRLAVANDEPALLTRVPGIGIKTARKILFHLKDRLASADLTTLPAPTAEDTTVIEALTALGYSVVEAQRAVQAVPREVVGIEERLRAALAQLAP